jgi:hypothetical protein
MGYSCPGPDIDPPHTSYARAARSAIGYLPSQYIWPSSWKVGGGGAIRRFSGRRAWSEWIRRLRGVDLQAAGDAGVRLRVEGGF